MYVSQDLYDLTRAKYKEASPHRPVPAPTQSVTSLSPLITADDMKHVKLNKFNMPGKRFYLRYKRRNVEQGLLKRTLLKCTRDASEVLEVLDHGDDNE